MSYSQHNRLRRNRSNSPPPRGNQQRQQPQDRSSRHHRQNQVETFSYNDTTTAAAATSTAAVSNVLLPAVDVAPLPSSSCLLLPPPIFFDSTGEPLLLPREELVKSIRFPPPTIPPVVRILPPPPPPPPQQNQNMQLPPSLPPVSASLVTAAAAAAATPSATVDSNVNDRIFFIPLALTVSRETVLRGIEDVFGVNLDEIESFTIRRPRNCAFLRFKTLQGASRFLRKLDDVSTNGPVTEKNGVDITFKENYKGDIFGMGQSALFYRVPVDMTVNEPNRPDGPQLNLDIIPVSKKFHDNGAQRHQHHRIDISKAEFAELLFSIVERRLERDLKSVFPEHPGKNWGGDGMVLVMSKTGRSAHVNKKTIIRAELQFKSTELSKTFEKILDDVMLELPFFGSCRVVAYMPPEKGSVF